MEIRKLLWAAAVIAALAVSCKKAPSGGGDKSNPDSEVITGNIQGTVVSTSGTPLEGVVVSDGLHCTKTNAKGEWGLEADFSRTDYVYVSTPSDYSAPLVEGTPVFWKFLKDLTKTGDKYLNVKFSLEKIDRPDRFSIIIYADPQPRSRTAGWDNMGYHSLDCCSDMYKDMKEYVGSKLTGRPVYGIGLGDIVHRNLSLLPSHKSGLASTGIRNYNVIGNHDHDSGTKYPAGTDEREAARPFEAILGPVNYSFNVGDFHILVLDNMICPQNADGTFSDSCNDGLRDDIWEWMQADLKYVPTDRKIMVCAHSPMFRSIGGNERSGSRHYRDYKQLLSHYAKVIHWAGHVHASMNYVNKADPTIESHSVTRVNGDLWTNEYLGSNGTPRGYVVFDYDGGNFKWYFKPIYYQTGALSGSYGGPATPPPYTWRDWDYENGRAVMRRSGKPLDESYQMQVFAPGTYPGSDGTRYLYANIFLWDELWELPKFTMNGKPLVMTRVTDKNYCYSLANREIKEYYKANNSYLAAGDYGFVTNNTESIFRIYVAEETGSGTVKVTDRFGNTYSSEISW